MVLAVSTGLVSDTMARISHQGSTALDAPDLTTNRVGEHLHEFPLQLSGELCWGKDTFTASNPASYVWELNNRHRETLNKALGHYKALNLAPAFVTHENFPLSDELHTLLHKISQVLHKGIGFVVLRGLNPNDYSDDDNIIMYAGLLSHIGSKRSTNAYGMSLEHIRDASLQPKPDGFDGDAELDPAKLNHGMSFHSDRFFADILAFYVRGKAAKGGDQHFASFWTVFNELRQNDPEALKKLTNDLIWPPRPDEADGLPVIEPMVLHSDGKVISQIIWAPFLANPEYLTSGLKGALDAVNCAARANSITVDSQLGDIQLLNNFAIMHSRQEFHDSTIHRRHLMRMGLRDELNAWKLPKFAEEKLTRRFSVDLGSQIMPVVDFDPWEITSTNTNHHG